MVRVWKAQGMVRFDKPCRHLHGAIRYFFEHLAKADYLSEGQTAPLLWVGKGAERLGLSGTASLKEFERLCRGQHPKTGQKLGVRDKGANRRICYFGQISPPKDVSIAYLVGGDERIAAWWKEAVNDTLREIEAATATRMRIGGRDEDRVTGNMVAVVVDHDASRSLDPQLHTHVCILNVTYDSVENRWKGVQPSNIYADQTFFREVCYNRLARRLLDAGYRIEKEHGIGFTIQGFPPELRKRFSKRREEILEEAAKLGIKSQDGLHRVAGSSRAEKIHVEPEELRWRWVEESGDDMAKVKETIAAANGSSSRERRISCVEAIRHAEEHLFERSSVAREAVFLREALIYGRGDVELAALRREIESKVRAGEYLRGNGKLTSREMLHMEREFTGWASVGRGRFGRIGDPGQVDSHLNPKQQRAIQALLCSRDRIVGLQGDAGTGKTTALKSVIRGIERGGGAFFACAPSSGATEVLRNELTPQADTLQQLLVNRGFQKQVSGRVLIVDEAGLISTRQMFDLCRLAHRNENRLILVGDIKQHSSVEAGDAFRAMQKFGKMEVAHLTDIIRQKDPYRQVVKFLAKKDAYQAFDLLDKLGGVREIADPQAFYDEAAREYVKTLEMGKSCLVISPVWSDIHVFTPLVRRQLREKGRLHAEERLASTFSSFQWTKAEQKDVRNYKVGDTIQFHRQGEGFVQGELARVVGIEENRLVLERGTGEYRKLNPRRMAAFDVGREKVIPLSIGEKLLLRGNVPGSPLKNGDIVELAGMEKDGSLRLMDGRILPSEFRQFTYGYAATSHASQGKTVDRGIVLMSDAGGRAANLKQAYVSNSRFREKQTIFAFNREAARKAMATTADRQLAMELLQQRAKRWKIVAKLIEAHEAWTACRQKIASAYRMMN